MWIKQIIIPKKRGENKSSPKNKTLTEGGKNSQR